MTLQMVPLVDTTCINHEDFTWINEAFERSNCGGKFRQ
jgi:hypothetical protein